MQGKECSEGQREENSRQRVRVQTTVVDPAYDLQSGFNTKAECEIIIIHMEWLAQV